MIMLKNFPVYNSV